MSGSPVWIVIIIVVLALLGFSRAGAAEGMGRGPFGGPPTMSAHSLSMFRGVRKVLPGLRPETPYETPTGGKAMQIDKQSVRRSITSSTQRC
jgi:hypothetical protein